MLSGGEAGELAYKAYSVQRCKSELSQVEIDNSFLNFLAGQSNIDNCCSRALLLASHIYGQKDGYTKPPQFVDLLEQTIKKPIPAAHRSYLALPFQLQKKDLLMNIYEQSKVAAENNCAASQNILGIMYEDGHAIPEEHLPQKDELAAGWYRKAAEHGFAPAQYNLALMYAKGRGVSPEELPRKDEIAVEWLRAAARQELPNAQDYLGSMYKHGKTIPDEELPRKDEIAVEWYRKAAVQGQTLSQYHLGLMYAEGRGIPAIERPRKDEIAVEWLRAAAEQGHVEAQYALGFMYRAGLGVPEAELQRDVIAFRWLRKAALAGHGEAQHLLAMMYRDGRGIPAEEIQDKNVMALYWSSLKDENRKKINEDMKNVNLSPYQEKKLTMLLKRDLTYPQVRWLFKERALKQYLLLMRLILKNRENKAHAKQAIEVLPLELLFNIGQFIAPLSTADLKDLYNKIIVPLDKEIAFKAKYYQANYRASLFFKKNLVATSVKSGAPLLLKEVEKYAKENPKSLEAQTYNEFNNPKIKLL